MLNISSEKLCYGTMTFGDRGIFNGIGFNDEKSAIDLVHFFYDAGVRKYDTAYGYSDGISEIMLGNALKSYNDIYISSKVSKSIHGNKEVDLSFKNIVHSCETSLKNLSVDVIDLFYLHSFDPSVPIVESVSALEWLCDHQMIREYGVCNFTAYQLLKTINTGTKRFTSVQYKCSFLEKNYTWDIVNMAHENEISIYGYSVLAGGLLTGKYLRNPTQKNYRLNRSGIKIKDEHMYKTRALYTLAQYLDMPIEKLAISSIISDLDYIIIGASNIQQAEYLMGVFKNG
ncbi:TPA: aldo/keto reductase [Salmonella enterica]|uniref:Aldo/keto reductase n=1 Tax=Salmonella enterica TaxID=28901 RepID=A0A765BGN6_SALER|nr:aldo/keto reductase [Salmonella enterica]HAG5356290.1 aldo/keto reductase [Salmonella enterica]